MKHEKRVATNPLTDEQICVRNFISEFVDSARLDVLRALDRKAMTPSAIQNRGLQSRQTASKHLSQFTNYGLTKPVSDQSGYELTAGGKLALDAIETCLEDIDRERLAWLARSTHTLQLLETLSTRPARPRELTKRGANSPSRATVQRALDTFVTAGWCRDMHSSHQLTSTGDRVLEVYGELALTIEQVLEKASWLQRLSPARADIPVHALADANVYVSEPDSPGIVLGEALKLCDPRLDRFRALTSIYNPTLFRAYDKLLKLGLAGEAIVDSSVYTHLHDEDLEHFLDDSEYDTFRIYRLEEPLTFGIGLYDDRKVAIGAYNETGEGDHIAMLTSSHNALVEWGTELYNSYQEQALHALERPPEVTG